MTQKNLAFSTASAFQNATGVSGPGVVILLLIAVVAVWIVARIYRKRRRK